MKKYIKLLQTLNYSLKVLSLSLRTWNLITNGLNGGTLKYKKMNVPFPRKFVLFKKMISVRFHLKNGMGFFSERRKYVRQDFYGLREI